MSDCSNAKCNLKLSVVTVVYNAASRLPGTIESVISQDYDNIEYIIKDGGSTDGTVEVIKEYAGKYDNIKYVSGKDEGIYDAMNTAVAMSTGDVLEFLNAGDRFVAPDVVSSAMKVMSDTGSDVVYGDVLYIHQDGRENVRTYPQPCSSKLYFLTGDAINHQVMFARSHLFGDAPFDNSYRICADREWMLRKGVYSSRCKMRALGFVVASYPLDGLSVIQSDVYKRDADRCIKKYMPWGYPVYAVFEFMRANAFLAELLHKVYEKLYVRR